MEIFYFLKKTYLNFWKNKSIHKPNKKKLIYFDDVYKRCLSKYDLNIDVLSQSYSKNICINCGCVLNIEIKTSRNCPECKRKIIVRTDMYSKRKIILSNEMLKTFERYDKEVREILFMERIMKKNIAICGQYMSKFKSIKEDKRLSARDIMYQFVNYVGRELDNKAYKEYMKASKLPSQDRVLKSFDAISNFRSANIEYVFLYKICMYKEKYDVAISLLAHIIYREIQITALDIESNPYHKATIDDFLCYINTNKIKELIDKSEYKFEDFKKLFLEQKHPFILPKMSNEASWKYVEMAMNKIDYD